jgi:hypothetical protein
MSARYPEPVTVNLDYCEWIVITTLLRNEYIDGQSPVVTKLFTQLMEYNK